MPLKRVGLTLAVALAASPGAAKDKTAPAAPPAALAKLLGCRAETDATARLACFDTAVASLDQAVAGGDVAVVDREDIRRTKRGLFGFTLGDLPLFGRRGDDAGQREEDEVKEITATLRGVAQGPEGFIFTLEDGARWAQTDSVTFGRAPKPGDQVTIRRMALGSYKLSPKVGPSVKVRRIG